MQLRTTLLPQTLPSRRVNNSAAAGKLQGGELREDCVRALWSVAGHLLSWWNFLGGGLSDSDSPLGRCHHTLFGKADASALASLLSAVDGLDTPLEVDTADCRT